VSLIYADAVNTRRRVAAGKLLLAMESDVSCRTGAMSSAVMGDETGSSIVTDHGIASVELLFAKLALVSYYIKGKFN